MNCRDVIEQLSDYLDEDAQRELCETIEAHLDHCSDCKITVDRLRKTILLYRGDQPLDLPASVSAQLRAALAREYDRGPSRAD